MLFTSLSFVFAFLPISILLFYASPKHLKTPMLLMISLLFYTMLDPANLLLMLLSITYDYLMAWLILQVKRDVSLRKFLLGSCILKNIALIVVFGLQFQLTKTPPPLGLMVYTLTSMGYVIDVYWGDARFEKNWMNYALFCTFYGKIFMGPLVQYSDLQKQMVDRRPSLSAISTGIVTFVGGLAKHVILAQGANKVYHLIEGIPQENLSVLSVWFLVLSFTFSLYFFLSGFCDMAQGLALIYSMTLPENYHYPFQSRTVSDFFNRFNITVTQYINRYVYIMLGGHSNGTASTVLNTLLTAMLLGLWFGIRLNYLMWGCYFALLILLEQFFLNKYLIRMPPFLTRIYTFALVMLSFTIFAGNTLGDSLFYLKTMFGLGGRPFFDGRIAYILSSNYLVLLLCLILLTSLGNMAAKAIRKKHPLFSSVGSVLFNVGVLLLSVSMML